MAGVFISYRHHDSAGWAGRLKDHLEARFGSELVWQDVDKIPAGANWLDRILSSIEHADAVLIVIGPRWLELGAVRLQDPKDVLRMEISRALSSTALVVPVLVGGAALPDDADLPMELQPLRLRQASTILDTDWKRGVDLLIEAIRQAIEKTRDRLPLQAIHDQLDQLFQLQDAFFEALVQNAQEALAISSAALTLLDQQQPQYPRDARLQLFRGYFEKNRALALEALGDDAGAHAALARAETVFQVMRTELEEDMAGAYNGIGSVALMRRRFDDGLRWIDKALELIPEYPQALHDRKIALQFLGRKPRARRKRRDG